MSETKQEKRTFKWGDNEYLLDDLLKLHSEQEQNYYKFAKDRGQYDDTALNGLRTAIASRVNAVKNGQVFDADGVLESDVVDNTSIQTQKKGLFKKEKYVDQDNTEWAKYYLNKLVGQLKPYTKEEPKNTGGWDISKHGLHAYLTGQGLNAQDIFEGLDKRNESDPEANRSYAQRHAELRKRLEDYKNWLTSKGFDFTKNDNEWDDDFVTSLDYLINNQDWSDNIALSAALRKLGAGDAYTTAFTSDRWDLSKTDDDLKAEKKKRNEEEAARQKKAHMDEFEDVAYGSRRESNPIYYTPFDYSNHDFRGKEANFMNWYADLNEMQQRPYGTYLGRDNQKWGNAWSAYTNSLKGGPAYTDKNLGVLLQGTFASQPHAFVDLGNGNYLIRDSVTNNGQGTVYNPSSGYTDTVFLGDLAGSNSEIKDIYKQLAYKYANDKYGTTYDDRPDIFKEGGEFIPKHQYGTKVVYNWETPTESIEPKAKANHVSVETQKAKDKYIAKSNKSEDNPDAGLTTAQIARIGYAMADLTSAVAAFAPGAGTAVSAVAGLGSTMGNFISDLKDDAVTSKETWRNFGMNLGMDALGLIPGGGAASKMGKIVRSLKTVVPMIIALPGVASMLANSPEIAQSWKRAFDGKPENGGEKMTYQDYMNILQVLNVAAAGTNIARNRYKSSKAASVNSDKIAIDVVDGNGTRKALVLEGADVGKFKEANAKGEAQKFINSVEGGSDFKIAEVTASNKGKFWGKNADGKFEFFHQNPLGQSGTGKANVLEVKTEIVRDYLGRPIIDPATGQPKTRVYTDTGRSWKNGSDLMETDMINLSGRRTLPEFQQHHQGRVDSYIQRLRADAEAYGTKTARHKQQLERTKQNIQTTEADLNTKNAEIQNLTTSRGAQAQAVADIEAARLSPERLEAIRTIRDTRKTIAAKKAEIAGISGKGKQKKINKLNDEIAALQNTIKDKQAFLDTNSKAKLNEAKNAVAKTDSEISKLNVETAKLQRLLDRLNPYKTNLETRIATHSSAFDRLLKFKPVVRQFNGKDYTFGTAQVEADLLNAGLFKQGGSVDRNKINKFLNYAKG